MRWAILGTSFISGTIAQAIARHPDSTATMVFGRDEARRRAFAETHGIDRHTASLDEAVTADEVDVVYVGLPNHVHHEAVRVAADAGKAVLSEKSLTVTMDQAHALVDAVRGRVFFVEGLMYLAHPLAGRWRALVGDGRLGELTGIHAGYTADIWRFVHPQGGGAIHNLGCYPASLVQLVIDTALGAGAFTRHRLVAQGRRSTVDGNVADTTALVHFDGGPLATVHTAETYGMDARFEVHGTAGVLRALDNPWLPQSGVSRIGWYPYDGEPEVIEVYDPLDAFDHQIAMVERCLAEGRLEAPAPSPALDTSLALMQLLVHWREAAAAVR